MTSKPRKPRRQQITPAVVPVTCEHCGHTTMYRPPMAFRALTEQERNEDFEARRREYLEDLKTVI